jgi:hypothetical protein
MARRLGYVTHNNHPLSIWGRGSHDPERIHHEWTITRILISLRFDSWLRGKHVGPERSDAEAWLDGEKYFLEWHSGSIKSWRAIARRRMGAYERSDGDVLWVCADGVQLEWLGDLAPDDRHWFAVLDDVRGDGRKVTWINRENQTSLLPGAGP